MSDFEAEESVISRWSRAREPDPVSRRRPVGKDHAEPGFALAEARWASSAGDRQGQTPAPVLIYMLSP